MRASGYLEHLTERDLALLGRAGLPPDRRGADGGAGMLRSHPELIERLLADPRVFDRVFPAHGDPAHGAQEVDPLVVASPFLVFALLVHRVGAELERAWYVEEWVGPKRRLPVFGTSELRDFCASAERRFFLAELLASFSHISGGTVRVREGRTWKRRRYSELDPLTLARLLEHVPEDEQPGIYRRLGDVTLFLTGVFPDHTATRRLGPLERERLRRAGAELQPVQEPSREPPDAVRTFEELGARSYRAACARAGPPLTGSMRVVEEVAARFGEARRVLNALTDQYLYPLRSHWFPSS